ncbi:MAG: molybdopterin biosynthesis protein [Candidatus Izimaplasma sp.]|nr:molybdopterin biosynthesis protein [Candidatus Izimaplasma bacterium]
MKRKIYLNSIDLKEITPLINKIVSESKYQIIPEEVETTSSLNRITHKAIFAKVSSPYYNAAAMDGVTLVAAKTYLATETNPVTILKEDYKEVNTGNVIPPEFDAVVMIEDVMENMDGSITLLKSVRPFQDIRPIGEDIVEGDMILPKNHKIRPVDISALLSGGIGSVNVIKKPDIAIIPTGDEIIRDIKELKAGKIIDSNSFYIKNELDILGCEATILSVQKDIFETLENTILKAVDKYDLVIIGAGSSAGTKDYAKAIIEKNGTVYVHGIGIKPGKPTIIGKINETPIVGLPGYPVSTFIAFDNVVRPIIVNFLNQEINTPQIVKAKLTKKVYSSLRNHEFIRVKLGVINNEIIATPLDRGAGVTMSLVKADGIMVIEKNSEGYEAMSYVDVYLLKDLKEIEKSLIVIGSHDILLDKVDDLMSNDKFHLSSTHIGSFGGIMAIKNKGCHIAPVHILHEDGKYNEFIIDKYLDNTYSLVRGVSRIQGLYVKKGNPKNIKSLKDLTRDDITFVNRQRGSGTRILLDYLLKEEKIDKAVITGYEFELGTHMLVASSVKDPRYDTGMGVASVANLMGLNIIELGEEHYDFIVLNEIIDTPLYNQFIKVLKSKEFKNELDKLGGYSIDNIGELITNKEVIL